MRCMLRQRLLHHYGGPGGQKIFYVFFFLKKFFCKKISKKFFLKKNPSSLGQLVAVEARFRAITSKQRTHVRVTYMWLSRAIIVLKNLQRVPTTRAVE